MIALALDTAEDLAEAIFLTAQNVVALTSNATTRYHSWVDLDPAERDIKIAAAQRLIRLYQIQGLTGVTVRRREV